MRARQGVGRGNWKRRACRVLLAGVALSLGGVRAEAKPDDVRIVAIEPARTDSTLECTVVTAGLPDERSRETLTSGLPSSLTLSVTLLDASGRERGTSQAEIRIEPDPWERTFLVRAPFAQLRAASMDELASHLRRLGPVVVARPGAFDLGRPMRLRVRLAVHALAPAEADRAHSLFVGDLSGNGADRREVSAGLGPLLRYFLGRAPASRWRAEALSAPFDLRALARGSLR